MHNHLSLFFQSDRFLRCLSYIAAVAMLFALLLYGSYDILAVFKNNPDADFLLIFSVALLFLILTPAIRRINHPDSISLLMLCAISAVLVFVRVNMFTSLSGDYNMFLMPWTKQLSGMTVRQFLVTPVGNYNLAYMYILYAISKIPIKTVFLIKSVSCIFDVAMAYFAMQLAGLRKSKYNIKLITYFAVLGLPTVLLNSAFWGQCDSIYAAFILAGLYFALKKRPNLSMLMFGLSFAFKFQAVIALPILVVLLFRHRLRILHFIEFAVVYVATLLPALIAGRTFGNTFLIYLSQVQSQHDLTDNAATFFSLMGSASYSVFNTVGIAVCFIAVMGLLLVAYRKRDRLNISMIIDFIFAFSLIVPYLLPGMHDRYFYLTDICAIIYVAFHNRKWYYAAALFLCSFNDYTYYLFGSNFMDEHLSAIIRGAIIVLVIRNYCLQHGLDLQFSKKPLAFSANEGSGSFETEIPEPVKELAVSTVTSTATTSTSNTTTSY